jgi:hypothetical protein
MLSVKTASPVQCPPRGLHREQTLGEGFGERKGSFAERNLTLGEDLESGSGNNLIINKKDISRSGWVSGRILSGFLESHQG